jgi:hypothetical protein
MVTVTHEIVELKRILDYGGFTYNLSHVVVAVIHFPRVVKSLSCYVTLCTVPTPRILCMLHVYVLTSVTDVCSLYSWYSRTGLYASTIKRAIWIVLAISVVFCTIHEVGREQGVLTIRVVFSTVHESKEYLLSKGMYMYVLFQVLINQVSGYFHICCCCLRLLSF